MTSNDEGPIHQIYLPFTEEQLRKHFSYKKQDGEDTEPSLYTKYYVDSAIRYERFLKDHLNRAKQPLDDIAFPCQIEKDERIWTATALMGIFHSPDRIRLFKDLMSVAYGGPVPPIEGLSSWEDCLDGQLDLYFEIGIPRPSDYKNDLAKSINEHHLIPFLKEKALAPRARMEGPTKLDALIINRDNGFSTAFEAKVLSDISSQTTFDIQRNQLARNIDALLDAPDDRRSPFCKRRVDRTLFVLITPECFTKEPKSRLYQYKFDEYRKDFLFLKKDLKHRTSLDDNYWELVCKRLGWLTWEDFHRVNPQCCSWLGKK